jgi:hypothetical protein
MESALLPSEMRSEDSPPDNESKILLNGDASAESGGSSKEEVLNDMTNTGVMAALVGGFALSGVQHADGFADLEGSTLDNITYLLLVMAVHACTCSALTSALVYRAVNMMPEEAVPRWALKNWMMLLMPIVKFGMGCAAYLMSVIFGSWRSLEMQPLSQTIALVIGISSMMTVMMTIVCLQLSGPSDR